MDNVPFQLEFRPDLPNVYGTVDYREFRETLTRIDAFLSKSHFEDEIVKKILAQHVKDQALDSKDFYNSKNAVFQYKTIRHALRCNIARHLVGESYRLFSLRLADSQLLQWFTGISALLA